MSQYADQIRRLQELGPGSPSHHALVEDVAALADLDHEVHRDTHTSTRWDAEPEQVRLTVAGRPVALSSAWPWSGETTADGVTAPLVLLEGRRKKWASAAGKIAVVEVHDLDVPAGLLLRTWGGALPLGTVTTPVIGSELAGTDLGAARSAGVLGVVAVWRGLPDDAALAQYLPVTRDHQGIPAVWAPESQTGTVLDAARAGATAATPAAPPSAASRNPAGSPSSSPSPGSPPSC